MTRTRTGLLAVVAIAVAAALVLMFLPGAISSQQAPMSQEVTQLSPDTLNTAASRRVYFGHQSVGANVVSGIPVVFSRAGSTAPNLVETSVAPIGDGGYFAHSLIGVNGDPNAKIRAFGENLSGGLAEAVDVAMMKLCYVDITAGTDAQAVFDLYSKTMGELEASYPDVNFLYTTVPLTTEATGPKSKLKSLLGRTDQSAADNVVREQYNQLVRQKYAATDRLYDIAALESTAPDGSRVSGTSGGQAYFALYGGYASDDGHLNESGSALAATKLLSLIASTTSS